MQKWGKVIKGQLRDKPNPENLLFWDKLEQNFMRTVWVINPREGLPIKVPCNSHRNMFSILFPLPAAFSRSFWRSEMESRAGIASLPGLHLSRHWFTPLTVEQWQSSARCYGLTQKLKYNLEISWPETHVKFPNYSLKAESSISNILHPSYRFSPLLASLVGPFIARLLVL